MKSLRKTCFQLFYKKLTKGKNSPEKLSQKLEMKLGAFLIAATMAGRADKRGKSGRRDMSNERYIWQSPRCMVNEALCDPTCNLEINQEPFKNLKRRFS